jgi:L-fuconolactonase
LASEPSSPLFRSCKVRPHECGGAAMADDWLSKTVEEPLEPGLPIIDPHHHLWDRPGNRYMLEELVADLAGQNVRQTVFVECSSMYRAGGPEEFRVVGETEFVQGIAAMSASGGFGDARACAGIVGSADLTLGDRVVAVLEAQIAASPQRFRGIRHRAA